MCKVCWENYRCTCPNAVKAGIACLHIHAVVSSRSEIVVLPSSVQHRRCDIEYVSPEHMTPEEVDDEGDSTDKRQQIKEKMQVFNVFRYGLLQQTMAYFSNISILSTQSHLVILSELN